MQSNAAADTSQSLSSVTSLREKPKLVIPKTSSSAATTIDTSPDAFFNGYPVYHKTIDPSTDSIASQMHCIGETNNYPVFQRGMGKVDMTWATRSCHFQFFCLDMDTREYVIYLPKTDIPEAEFDKDSDAHSFESHQTVFTNKSVHGFPYAVAVGGVNLKWSITGAVRVKWFPRVEYDNPPTSFYALPANVTLMPFHSLAAFNPGHLVWDDFLPIYTLAQIFELDDQELFMLRHTLDGEALWATCDWKEDRKEDCAFMLRKFGPLMNRNPSYNPSLTQRTVNLTMVNANEKPKSNLVCARHGLAGLGALTDHGTEKGHGWEPRDYDLVYNHGRGGQLWRFRNFMMTNLGLKASTAPPGPPYRIIFSEKSSKMAGRSLDFSNQVQALLDAGIGIGEESDVTLNSYQMSKFSLTEQAEMVGSAAMYITGCGGGAVTATFLPRGASLIVYYSEQGGISYNKRTGLPALLDWDYFNNMGYVRAHWFAQTRKDSTVKTEGFVDLRMMSEDATFHRFWTASSVPMDSRGSSTSGFPDGFFNGYPVYHKSVDPSIDPITSQMHCIGETNNYRKYYQKMGKVDTTWTTRSCHFQFMCLDMNTREYVIYLPKEEIPETIFRTDPDSHPFESHQTVFTDLSVHGHPFGVAIGAFNTKWIIEGALRTKWFPRVEYDKSPTSFYALPANVTLMPFHSMAAFNPGHLVWDDFLPLYTLAQIFEMDDRELLLLRHTLDGGPLWATCDWPKRAEDCAFMLRKFGPLMNRNPDFNPSVTQRTVNLTLTSNHEKPRSNLVCARHGLAGLGALSDHGTEKGHGWESKDYELVYNHGRGGQLWRFRNFMMKNLGIPVSSAPPGPPYRIIFSEKSSESRSLSFLPQMQALKLAGIGVGADSDVVFESYQMSKFTLVEQASMVGSAAMYVTGCGGGAVTATFLPRGASLIVYYQEAGGFSHNKRTGLPALLDWDYFNNMGYARAHWFAQSSKDSQEKLEGFVELVKRQLSILRDQRAAYEQSGKE
eukprot:Nitzschia sp. Nitz4//scaffold109_size72162//3119//6690//NITZ4_005832-RA/size72162-snap-gene-0.91-mRNA-1//1//CDS//3329532721//4787//frame0